MTAPISPFLKTDWTPADYFQVKIEEVKNELKENGFICLNNFFGKEVLLELKRNYELNHKINAKQGGLFISIFSKNLDYRNQMNKMIKDTLASSFQDVFIQYKAFCHFYVKAPGLESEVFIHQDNALLDEFLFSPLKIWFPLDDVNIENGPICFLPRSHYILPPYRNNDGEAELPFSNIYNEIFKYTQPVLMKAGDALIFDPRLCHLSLINRSPKNRVCISVDIFPQNSFFQLLYKNAEDDSVYDIVKIEDDAMMNFKAFATKSTHRVKGSVIKQIKRQRYNVTEEQLLEFCKQVSPSTHNLPTYFQKNGLYNIPENYLNSTDTSILQRCRSSIKDIIQDVLK